MWEKKLIYNEFLVLAHKILTIRKDSEYHLAPGQGTEPTMPYTT